MKDVEKEKQRIEMQKIEQKYGPEILSQVHKDMGLPTLPVPNLMLSPSQIPGTSFPPSTLPLPQGIPHSGITPSSLLAKVKQEKYQRTKLADPDNQYKPSPSPSSGGEKCQFDAGCDSTPPPKRFVNKDDIVNMLTPKAKKNTARQCLFYLPRKTTPGNVDVSDNSLEIQSSDYMKSLSAVKYDLMMAAHIFLNERVPKDYAAKVWKTIVENNLLVEKKTLTEQNQDSFFSILAKQFPEFSSEEPRSITGKIRRMLCRFACVNCINFSEVGNNDLFSFPNC